MKYLGIISFLVVVAACVADPPSCTTFSCSTQLPAERLAGEAEPSNPPFVIRTSPRAGFILGDDINVEIATKEGTGMTFTSFILQAQVPSDDSQMGSFEPSTPSSTVSSCEGHHDTLVNSGHDEVEYVTATWKPPANMDISKTVEFDATVQTKDCKFWMIHSVLIRFIPDPAATAPPSTNGDDGDQDSPHDGETDSETGLPDDFEQPRVGNEGEGDEDEGTGEDPNEAERLAEEERLESIRRDEEGEALDRAEEEAAAGEDEENDDHGRRAEEDLLQQHLEYLRQIDDEENQAGEDTIAIELRHEKELHEQEIEDERAESEKLRAEEKKQREERIRLEIIDKEEYDAWVAQQERESGEIDSGEVDSDEIDVGDGSGASMVHSVGILSAVLAVLVATLW